MSEREDELEHQLMEIQLKEAMYKTQKKAVTLTPVGVCYNCEETIATDRTFCDSDCRDDYEKRKKAEAQRLY